MRSTYKHQNNGPFVKGIPTEQGWYWFYNPKFMSFDQPEPCKVVLGQGENVRIGVLMWGWGKKGEIFELESALVRLAYFAPTAIVGVSQDAEPTAS